MPNFIFLSPGEASIRDATEWKRKTENKIAEMEVRKMEMNKEKNQEESVEKAKEFYLSEAEAEFHETLSMRTPEEKHLAICQP